MRARGYQPSDLRRKLRPSGHRPRSLRPCYAAGLSGGRSGPYGRSMISGSSGTPDGGGAEFTAEGLEPVLREACARAGLDSSGVELLRLGSNAVYRLTSLPIIVRIARDPSVLAEM